MLSTTLTLVEIATPINEAGVDSLFRGEQEVRGGEGCRDIRAGIWVSQEVQNVIFDIPKSFQLIKAPSLPG